MNIKVKFPLIRVFCLLALLGGCIPATGTPLPSTATVTAIYPPPTETSIPVPSASATPFASATVTPEPSATPNPPLRFAVIGDFGEGNQGEADVASMIHGWNPDIIITVGDNNYPSGASDTIDARVGQYYHDFIFPYTGKYGAGASENRFFPTLGNHDWYTAGAKPYLDYFTLPGNERYYDFVRGPVHFFAVDSEENEPDGFRSNSVQAAWLKQAMAASTSPWNIVYFHTPPYSSGVLHGSATWMRWPFVAWGAQAVLSGHEHTYERLLVEGIPYFVNGVGGGGIYNFGNPLPESQFRYNADYGAMLVTASEKGVRFEFHNRTGTLIDQYDLSKP
jgi:tartrate-resistant acid phosphatase type 5